MVKPKRPFVITFLACLNLLFGVVVLASTASAIALNYSLFNKPAPVAPEPDDPNAPPRPAGSGALPPPTGLPHPPPIRPIPDSDVIGILKQQQKLFAGQVLYYDVYITVASAAGFLLGGLLLGSGIGLWMLNPVGRRMAIGFALIAPFVGIGSAYFYWENMRPQLKRWETNRNDQLEKLFHEPRPTNKYEMGFAAAVGISLLVSVGYAPVLLAGMVLPGVRAAFRWRRATAQPPPQPPSEAGISA